MTKPELPGRAGYDVIEHSRFDALEEELASLMVPWDSDADAARIAKDHGLPDDARFIAAARARMRASHVDPYKDTKTERKLFSVCLFCGGQLRGTTSHARCSEGEPVDEVER